MNIQQSKIVDPHGRPLTPEDSANAQRVRRLTASTKAFIVTAAAFVAFLAGVLANMERIVTFLSPSMAQRTEAVRSPAPNSALTKDAVPSGNADPKDGARPSASTDVERPTKPPSVLFVDILSGRTPVDLFDAARDAIRRAWHGPASTLQQATIEQFLEELERPHRIIHIEANIGHDDLEFNDGRLTGAELSTALKARSVETDCVVLACCNSFLIGKALEKSNVKYSLVVTRYLELSSYETFFLEFYGQLSKGEPIPIAYERARLKTKLAKKHGAFAEFEGEILLTRYGEAAKN